MSNKKIELSKFLSMILRHKPYVIGIELDKHGFADTKELLKAMVNYGKYIDMDLLEQIVLTDNKQRYSFNEDKTKIRANQGHSIHVDVEFKELKPPDTLYHGTATRFLESIKSDGLKSMTRLYVHLSSDISTAIAVGKRHGIPIVLKINSSQMYRDGFKFYFSENRVWLCKHIPTEYIDFNL